MKKWIFASMVLLLAAVGCFTVYQVFTSDRQGPEIKFSQELYYEDGMTEEELLFGVSAVDQEDGDVSDSLVIEKYTFSNDSQSVLVTYAARDSKNNVSKASRTILFSDAYAEMMTEEETETESDSETWPETEEESELVFESESEELEPGDPVIYLTEVYTEIEAGDDFDPLTFVDSIEDDYDNHYDLWRDIQVVGDYDVNEPDIYELEYYVVDSSGNRSNTAKFWLIVREAE